MRTVCVRVFACWTILPDDQVVIFDQRVEVSLVAADVQHDGDGVGIFGGEFLRLRQQRRRYRQTQKKNSSCSGKQ